MSKPTNTIELAFGYTDKDGKTHKKVTFGKRPKVRDFILLDTNPQAQSPTQYEQLVKRLMITEFGTLTMPVMLPVLVKLDTADNDRLTTATDNFLQISREERQGELLPDNEVRLIFGIEIDGVIYDIAKFGNRLTVADNVEADNLKLGNGVARTAFQIGKQICELRHSESGLKIQGQVTVENLSGMDSEDFNLLRLAAEFFRVTIPGAGKSVNAGIFDSAGDGMGGKGNSESAD